jgi:hypothetical protein
MGAEYLATYDLVSRLNWLVTPLEFMGCPQQVVEVEQDNESLIRTLHNGSYVGKSKFFQRRVDLVIQEFKANCWKPKWVAGMLIKTDYLTKVRKDGFGNWVLMATNWQEEMDARF